MYRYISDLHIGCTNSFDGRTLEHDEILVKNWNSVVHNNDTTFILGDIGRLGSNKDNEYVCSVISRLKSRKILIVGNHDESGLKDYRVKQLFDSVCDYFELTDNYNGINQKLVLSHYPIFSWNGCYKDTILLYGHTHGNFDDHIYQSSLKELRSEVILRNHNPNNKKFKQEPYAYNVGAMMPYMNYTPRTFFEIKKGIEEYEKKITSWHCANMHLVDKWVAFKQEGMKPILHGRIYNVVNETCYIKCKNGQIRWSNVVDLLGCFDSKKECYEFK